MRGMRLIGRRRDVLKIIFRHIGCMISRTDGDIQTDCSSLLTNAQATVTPVSGESPAIGAAASRKCCDVSSSTENGCSVAVNCEKSIRENKCQSHGAISGWVDNMSVLGSRRVAEKLAIAPPKTRTSSG